MRAEREGTMAEPQSVEDAIAIDHNARRLAAEPLARNCRNGILALQVGRVIQGWG